MRCYECAVREKGEEAVGCCALCGRGVCLGHSRLERTPQYRNTGGGIGGPYVRCAQDKARLVCRECAGAESETAEQSHEGRDG